MLEKQFVTRVEWRKHTQTHPLIAHGIWAKIKNYVPAFGYSQSEINAMWSGYSGTKGQVAWANVLKTGSNLTDLVTRQHAGLTNVTTDQHHAQAHTLASHSTKPHSTLTGVTENQHHTRNHNILSADHPDSLVGGVVRGDIIIGNATPKWSRLAKGATGKILMAGENDVIWSGLNLGGLSDVNPNFITPYEACLLAYHEGDWVSAMPEYDIRFKSYDIKWDFETATPPAPWAYGALNAGTVSTAWTINHPGTAAVNTRFDGDASNSGYYWVAANNKISINGLEQADFVFYTPASLTNVRFRLGFQDSITIATPNDGIYLEVAADATLRGVTIKGGAAEYTGTTYALATSTWYRGRIIVPSTPTDGITFRLYSEAGAQLWEQTNLTAANIPTGASYVGFGVVCWISSDLNSTMVIRIDLADFICARGLTR